MDFTVEELQLLEQWFTYFAGETTVLDEDDEWYPKSRELITKIKDKLEQNGIEVYRYF